MKWEGYHMRETGGVLAEHIRKNKVLYLMAFTVFFVGIALGAGTVNTVSDAAREELNGYFGNFLSNAKAQDIDFIGVLKVCAGTNLKYALFSLVISLTVFTLPLHALLLGIKGFSVGFTVGFLIRLYQWKGVLYGLLAAFPSAVVSVPVCAMIGVMCVGYACRARQNRDRITAGEKRTNFWMLVVTLGLLFALLCVGSLFDAFLSPVVIKLLFPA